MYQGTGELKNFQSSKSSTHEPEKFQSSKSSSHVTNHSMFKDNQGKVKCQSFTVEIKFKCDDLDHQVSITNN